MLNAMQRDIIRTGYRAAEKTGDEAALLKRVQQLAKDFGVGEDEIYGVVKGSAGTTPPIDQAVAAAQEFAKHRDRRGWTSEETRQLEQLRGEGKGPVEIAKALGCDVRRVQSKLHNLKKDSTQTQPAEEARGTPEPADAGPDLALAKEKPAVATSAPDSTVGKDYYNARSLDYCDRPESDTPALEAATAPLPAENSEYDALRAKLAEPEPPGINLMRELLDLMGHFELAYSAKVGMIQAKPAAGWAACSFDVRGRRYTVSLRAQSKEASS